MMRVLYWGEIDYQEALFRQKDLVDQVSLGGEDVLVLCEHPVVITVGRSAHVENILMSQKDLKARGIQVVNVGRGGDVTLHAPGQLIVYPILHLKRAKIELRKYLVTLEQVVVAFLKSFGIVAKGDDNRRGVWVDNRKVASIGISVSRWVSFHGVGLNISTDLELFSLVRPCGLLIQMTSLSECLGRHVVVRDAMIDFERSFLNFFNTNSTSRIF